MMTDTMKTNPGTGNPFGSGNLAHCALCGSVGYTGDKYCACCGGAMPLCCPHCDMVIRQRIAHYCPHCGRALEKK